MGEMLEYCGIAGSEVKEVGHRKSGLLPVTGKSVGEAEG
jgi:hypothetical protein